MSNHIDPTPFIEIATPKGKRPRFGKELRVFLAGTVDVVTDRQVNRWAGKSLSIGLVIDQVVSHAKRTAFKPTRKKKTP